MMGVVLLTILVFALVGQAAWLATEAFRDQDETKTPAMQRVIDYTRITWDTQPVDTVSILRRQRLSRFPWLENLLTRFDLAHSLSRDLRSAGRKIQAAEFLFGQLLITTLAGFGAFLALPEFFGG